MRGIVTEEDQGAGGRIRGDDGETYAFSAGDVLSGASAEIGSKVDFIIAGSRAGDIYVLARAADLTASSSGAVSALAGNAMTLTEADRITARPGKGMIAYFFDCVFQKFAVFSGRARRREFFSFALIALLISGLAIAGDLFVFSDLSRVLADGDVDVFEADLFMPLTGAAVILLLLPGAAVSVRRLHDQKMTGWIFLLILAVPIGPLILFIVMLFDGFKATNKYGPSPKYAMPDSVPNIFA